MVRKITGRPLLAAWFVAMLLIGTSLLARHAVALPTPVPQDLAPTVAALRSARDRFVAVHVLYVDCRCSLRVAAHLLSSVRPRGLEEDVLLVGHDPSLEARFVSRGLRVHVVDEAALVSTYHVPAAPLLVIAAPDGTIRYAGGYTLTKQAYESHDLELLAAALAGKTPDALPLYGCPVSQRLKERLNPLEIP